MASNTYVSLNSIADLKAYEPAPPDAPWPPAVHVLGFYEPGDGGGGVFVWVPGVPVGDPVANPPLDDDRGLVIRSTVRAAGRWRRNGFLQKVLAGEPYETSSEPINVRWFGAVGDGKTQDDVAIQAAIDAAYRMRRPDRKVTHPRRVPDVAPNEYSYRAAPAVFFPTGTYGLSRPLVVPAHIALVGESLAILTRVCPKALDVSPPRLQPLPPIPLPDEALTPFPLLRIAAAFNDIDTLTFVGGDHSVALFGVTDEFFDVRAPREGPGAPVKHGTFHPAAYNNLPCRIRNCTFLFPRGPAIWQDTRWEVGTPGKPDFQTNNRSFQTPLVVSNFYFQGPHLFWGTGDWVVFENGLVNWDQVNEKPERTKHPSPSRDGLPLGCFNTGGNLNVKNCGFFSLGAGNNAPIEQWNVRHRNAYFVGGGNLRVTDCSNSDISGLVFVRADLEGDYRGHTLPRGDEEERRLALLVQGCDLASSGGGSFKLGGPSVYVNWLEVYDNFPRLISVQNRNPYPTFEQSLGIWVDPDIDWQKTLTRHKSRQVIRLQGLGTPFGFRIRSSSDPLAFRGPGVIDRTTELLHYLEDPHVGYAESEPQVNLFPVGVIGVESPSSAPFMERFTDDGSGQRLSGWRTLPIPPTVDQFHQLSFRSPEWGKALAAGVYVLSLYIRANFAGRMVLDYQYVDRSDPDRPVEEIVNVAERFFAASTAYQRVWYPFYFPGGGVRYRFGFMVDLIPPWQLDESGRTFPSELVFGLFCIHRGMAPAPYTLPAWRVRAFSYAAAPPTVGTYMPGDIVYHISPAPGRPLGWVCTAGSDPGPLEFRPFAIVG